VLGGLRRKRAFSNNQKRIAISVNIEDEIGLDLISLAISDDGDV
jgi:hypothetical protein